MKRVFATASSLALACALVTTVSAQQAPTTPDPNAAASSASGYAANKTVTVTGCLAGQSGNFTLSNASLPAPAASSDSSSASGTTGTSGSTSPSTTDNSAAPSATSGSSGASAGLLTYKLIGADGKLKDHVGHKVEVSGTVDKASTGMTGSTSDQAGASTAGTAGAAGSTAGTAMGAQSSFKVQSVRMLAATCS